MRPADSAFMSMPEQNDRPRPRTTTTQTSGSFAAASAWSASCATRSLCSALSTSGRLSVMVATPSLTS